MKTESKPLIYLLNTPLTVEKILNPSFNVYHYWMNGALYNNPSIYGGLEIPYSYALPSNLHEAEIVVIDTKLRSAKNNGHSVSKIIYRHVPSYIDLFPLDMNRALRDIFSTKKFQLLILFCESYNDENYIIQDEAGRNHQYQTNTYSFPNGHAASLQHRSGYRMTIEPGNDLITIKKCIEKYLPQSLYHFIFHTSKVTDSGDIPLLLNEAGEVVSFLRIMNEKITIFLPELKDKENFLLELFDKVLPDIPAFSNIFPNHGSFKWVRDFSYISIEERNKSIEIQDEIARHNEKIESLKEQYELIHNKDENVKLRNMLKETGDELVASVKWFLEYIGFTDIVDPDKDVDVEAGELFEEDLNFEYDGINFLLEVKGIGGTSTDAQCAQISKIALRRRRANPKYTYKAVYIVNHRRYKAPKERDDIPFNVNQIEDAELSYRGMTFTYELFNIYHMIEAGIISKAATREAFKQEGLIDFRKSIHKVNFNHCYNGAMVYSLILPEGNSFTLLKEDKIAIQDNENHWHLLNIESIQVTKKDVEEVSTGTFGVKVDRLVPEARDFYIVKTN